MQELKKWFAPLQIINKKTFLILTIGQAIIAILCWHFFHNQLIPSPFKIGKSILGLLKSNNFYDNLLSSFALIFKGMGISIIIAVLVSYLSIIPFFRPLANFIIKCRYLTLTGLVFLFTLITNDGSQLKLSLLIFGIVPFFVTSLLSIIDSINTQEYELCTTLRMNKWQTMYEVIILGKLDQVIEVMRQNFAIAWMMITMVEGISMSQGGLGTMMIKSSKYIDLSTVFAILFIILIIGICIDFLLGVIRHWLFPYTKIQILK